MKKEFQAQKMAELKKKYQVQPAIMGIGLMLAGMICTPVNTHMGKVLRGEIMRANSMVESEPESPIKEPMNFPTELPVSEVKYQKRSQSVTSLAENAPSLIELHKGSAFQFKRSMDSMDYADMDSDVYYYQSMMQFYVALVDIGDRLRTLPKPARQSSLIAELNLINHNLPAEICIPYWCPCGKTKDFHHKVVRISPDDAVVLNSADRVSKPYA
jgi:hypothetical protein